MRYVSLLLFHFFPKPHKTYPLQSEYFESGLVRKYFDCHLPFTHSLKRFSSIAILPLATSLGDASYNYIRNVIFVSLLESERRATSIILGVKTGFPLLFSTINDNEIEWNDLLQMKSSWKYFQRLIHIRHYPFIHKS